NGTLIKFAKNTNIAPPNGTENVNSVVIPPVTLPKFSVDIFSNTRLLTLGLAFDDMYASRKRNKREMIA
ncbi:hypothetical protein PJP06_29460, partial [Mycobacterium kansasii]